MLLNHSPPSPLASDVQSLIRLCKFSIFFNSENVISTYSFDDIVSLAFHSTALRLSSCD